LQKVHVETFSKTKRQNFDVSFDLFCFIAFSGVSQRWELKNTTKNVLQKNRVEKLLQKNRQAIQNIFFSRFLYVFGRFLVRGLKKRPKKYQKNKSDPGPFLASDPPTNSCPPTTGVADSDLFWAAPWGDGVFLNFFELPSSF
jgi:hypothetical protein